MIAFKTARIRAIYLRPHILAKSNLQGSMKYSIDYFVERMMLLECYVIITLPGFQIESSYVFEIHQIPE